MLDIGFSELMVIGIVALVVIGPERLPRVARTAGHLLGRFQRYVSEVKSDINREMELSELKNIQASVEEAARSIERNVKSEMQDAEQELRSAQAEIAQTGEAFKQAQTEIGQAFTLPHMGTMSGAASSSVAASDVPPGLASATSAPAEIAATADEPSPQLELGLSTEPPSRSTPDPRQAGLTS
jgi:sec-independent protein translocase protein TatB